LLTASYGARHSMARRHRTLARRVTLWCTPLLVVAGLIATPSTAAAQAHISTNPLTIDVTGSSLANIVTSPLVLTPAFDPAITDYVLRCQTGINALHASLYAAGGSIGALGSHGATIDVREDLVENEALVIAARAPRNLLGNQPGPGGETDENGRVQYWIRCLPADFPQLTVTRPSNPPPGWYLTGNLNSAKGSNAYAMVLDSNGSPVWYQRSTGPSAYDVTMLADDTIAWGMNVTPGFAVDPNGSFEVFNLKSQTTRLLAAPILPTDFHELQEMANGDLMMMSSPWRPNVDLTPIGGSSQGTIIDCVLEEVDRRGQIVWQWRASDHLSVAESTHPQSSLVGNLRIYDVFHCNSIDVDRASGNILLSARHTDAVYLIDRKTSRVIWRMGGSAPNRDGAQILTIAADPQGSFHAQHDARFQPNGDISLYDDQSWTASLTARGVEYRVDTQRGIATLVWSYKSPDGQNSAATGSFRRLDGGNDNVISWGVKPGSLFTEVDSSGRILLNVGFPSGEFAYRTSKVSVDSLNHGLLRATAGLGQFIPPPRVAFISPESGPRAGGGTSVITGSFFTGLTSVDFGSKRARVLYSSDTSITVAVPLGAGIVDIIVSAAGGQSSATPINQLLKNYYGSDSSFESGTGSWSAEVGTIALTSQYARTGLFSLQVSPDSNGAISASTGHYPVLAGAKITGGLSLLTPSGSSQLTAFVTFYDARGMPIASSDGPSVYSSTFRWGQARIAAVAPPGTATVSIGAKGTSAKGSLYLDDVSLSGVLQYSYT
jgi:hypothetical protein